MDIFNRKLVASLRATNKSLLNDVENLTNIIQDMDSELILIAKKKLEGKYIIYKWDGKAVMGKVDSVASDTGVIHVYVKEFVLFHDNGTITHITPKELVLMCAFTLSEFENKGSFTNKKYYTETADQCKNA